MILFYSKLIYLNKTLEDLCKVAGNLYWSFNCEPYSPWTQIEIYISLKPPFSLTVFFIKTG